jgi:hypothetical protein
MSGQTTRRESSGSVTQAAESGAEVRRATCDKGKTLPSCRRHTDSARVPRFTFVYSLPPL